MDELSAATWPRGKTNWPGWTDGLHAEAARCLGQSGNAAEGGSLLRLGEIACELGDPNRVGELEPVVSSYTKKPKISHPIPRTEVRATSVPAPSAMGANHDSSSMIWVTSSNSAALEQHGCSEYDCVH